MAVDDPTPRPAQRVPAPPFLPLVVPAVRDAAWTIPFVVLICAPFVSGASVGEVIGGLLRAASSGWAIAALFATSVNMAATADIKLSTNRLFLALLATGAALFMLNRVSLGVVVIGMELFMGWFLATFRRPDRLTRRFLRRFLFHMAWIAGVAFAARFIVAAWWWRDYHIVVDGALLIAMAVAAPHVGFLAARSLLPLTNALNDVLSLGRCPNPC